MGIRVYENNAGGLCMTDGIIAVHNLDSPERPGKLLADLTTWHEWADEREATRVQDPDSLGTLIAEYEAAGVTPLNDVVTLYLGSMGAAGMTYLGLNDGTLLEDL